jgi:hypothetical protein
MIAGLKPPGGAGRALERARPPRDKGRPWMLLERQLKALVPKAIKRAARMPVIEDLAKWVEALLEEEPELPWDAAVARIARGE